MAEPAPVPAPYVGFARKWRPQTFEDLVGQQQVSQALRSEVEKGRIGHAYLFAGPRGVGKTSAARILAKAINCEHGPTPSPCGQCAHCRGIAAGAELDVIEIDGASNNGVDQVRDLREHVNHVPFACRYKVYIIDEVHMLSIPAFNALLKTLEEPPRFVVFIFATTEIERIPETIKSRCEVFPFRAITVEDIVGRLDYILKREGVEVEPGERQAILETIALSAEGGMRDAQVALDQVVSLTEGVLRLQDVRDFLGVADRDSLFALVDHIRERRSAELLDIVRDLSERGRDLERFVKQVLAFLRDLMVLRCGGGDDLVRLTGETLARARELAADLDPALIVNAVNIFLDLEARMKVGTQTRFLLEFALVRLTALEGLTPIADLVQRLEGGGGGSGAPANRGAASSPGRASGATPRPARASGQPGRPGEAALGEVGVQTAAAPPRIIPLQRGGALEPVSAQDIGALSAMLAEAVRSYDLLLSRTLEVVPLEKVEGSTAYFGKPGQPISRYDARQFDKPETKDRLCSLLAQLTGTGQFFSIRVQGRPSLDAGAPPAPSVAPARPPRPPQPQPIEALAPREFDLGGGVTAAFEASPPEMDEPPPSDVVPPPPDMEEEEESAPVEPLDMRAEDVRRLFGKTGLSAPQARKLLKEDETLRSKVEMVRKAFKGRIVDGDGKPVKM
ncbi:MAG: DNA polymerase III subunit gamma/tau [Candidatus Sumerlaeota bacterium]|nr:DNA polymerase III subunit gamma/tau [Candidatus Sumerlaeota bacterium]